MSDTKNLEAGTYSQKTFLDQEIDRNSQILLGFIEPGEKVPLFSIAILRIFF